MSFKMRVLVWEDSSTKNNKVHGVVEINDHDIAILIANEFSRQFKKTYQHTEVRELSFGTISETELPVFKLDIEYKGANQ